MPIHIRATAADYAPTVLVPGDPNRARFIAEQVLDPGARLVNSERGALGYTGTFGGAPISVQASGMGCASASIYYTELVQLGARRLVRVGTVGGLADGMRMGDLVVAVSASPDDGIVAQLTNGEAHAPTATFGLVERAVSLARARQVRHHVGPIVSSALFYDPREGIMQRWKQRGHLAVEMEAAALYTIGAMHGVETVCIATVSDLITDAGSERIDDATLGAAVEQMVRLGCDVAVG
ncbi:MAG: purine-nucleoside phosphorylase [Ilumatobacteraceae bacterium]